MKKNFVFLAFVASFVFNLDVTAQLRWQQQDSLFGRLPANFHVYYSSGTVDGHPLKAWYVSVLLTDKNIQFNSRVTTRTPAAHSAGNPGAFLIVNGGLFDSTYFRLLSTVITNGQLMAYNITSLRSNQSDYYYYPTRSAFGISRKREADIAWLFTDTLRRWPYGFQSAPILARGKEPAPILADLNTLADWKEWKMRTAIGGGPVLVHDSKVRITNQEEQLYPAGTDDPDARTVIGYTSENRLIILATERNTDGSSSGLSLKQAAEVMKSLDCVEAMNLNVGSSAFMVINGKETIHQATPNTLIPVVFLIEPAGRERKKSRFSLR